MARSHTPEEIIHFIAQLRPAGVIEFLELLHRFIKEKHVNCNWLDEWSSAITWMRVQSAADAEDALSQQTDHALCAVESALEAV